MMKLEAVLQKVKSEIAVAPKTTVELFTIFVSELLQLGWSREQLSLWLACTPALQRSELPSGEVAWSISAGQVAPSLADEMVALLQKAGRPMPLAQLISKLPSGMLVTEPMLRSAAGHDARLELKGPLLKLAE